MAYVSFAALLAEMQAWRRGQSKRRQQWSRRYCEVLHFMRTHRRLPRHVTSSEHRLRQWLNRQIDSHVHLDSSQNYAIDTLMNSAKCLRHVPADGECSATAMLLQGMCVECVQESRKNAP